jgi:plastocyanin
VGSKESKTYAVTNSGSAAYVFNGEGLTNSSNPNFTFKRGGTYTFNVNTPGHPFYINSTQGTGTGNAYNSGVTRNGAIAGAITFTVPMNAPNALYYNCEFHGSMTGIITITD